MANRLVSAAFTAALTLWRGQARADEVPRPMIAVVVYDYTSLPDAMLQRAKDDVSLILRKCGIDVRWTGTAPEKPMAAFAIQILIRGKAAPASVSAAAAALGASLGGAHAVGGTAMLFRNRIASVARDSRQDVARLLAYAMAHEIGHLLLSYPAHATAGIMRTAWDGDDLRHIGDRTLEFSVAEVALLHAKAAGCCGGQRLSTSK
jgi:hypothetical protein